MPQEPSDFALITWAKLQPPTWQIALQDWLAWLLTDPTQDEAW